MAVALEQFVKQLTDSGVVAPGKLDNFVPPMAQPKDAQELARQLVQSKCLTKYQAQEIYQGRAKSLILGNYTILDKIGAGGMGQVFKAEHRRMHRVVAIKMLPKNVMQDAAAAARFQREVEAASKLLHPNIVSAFDADEATGVHFLAMEFVEGSDLSALVKKNGPFLIPTAVTYILQAAKGLEFAHGEGVVHRDIKPANLLLDKKGTVKILDMGLARISASDDAATQAELTGTGAVMGTVDYMAPEQALSTKHADARADIYSLGCSLYYLLTGKATYDGDTLMAKLLAHRDKPIPSLGTGAPEQLQTVFNKMVAKKIEDRYQTMSEVVAALEECSSSSQSSLSGNRQSIDTDPDSDALTFLKGIPAHTIQKSKPQATVKAAKKSSLSEPFKGKKKLIVGGLGAGIVGLAILAAIVFKLHTKDGTLVVEINQPDAIVQVLDADGKVEISQPGGKGAISISVDPGKHRLKVEKNGFKFFAQDFDIESGSATTIKATLVADKPLSKPAVLDWKAQVAAMPAEKQVGAIVKKLQELNPAFDGKETHKIENGTVVELQISAAQITSFAPVRALIMLRKFDCSIVWPNRCEFSDISPLRGLPLEELNLDQTSVCSLEALRGMPLRRLSGTCTRISDLAPLAGTPLAFLNLKGTAVVDVGPLQGLPLRDLNLTSTSVTDLSPLQQSPLERLDLGNGYSIQDLGPLHGMTTLQFIGLFNTPVVDLSPLAGLKLHEVDVTDSVVNDLSPLKGMPIERLECAMSNVADLSPLAGAPLKTLNCFFSGVTDLSPLKGMSLQEASFSFRNIRRGVEVLRPMQSLTKIADDWYWRPAAEFWTKYDAGEIGKPGDNASPRPLTPESRQWLKDVAALPAADQVAAVAKRLKELNKGFDKNATPKIQGGVVTSLTISGAGIGDISPIHALGGLQELNCPFNAAWPAQHMVDLAPLKGLPLRRLNVSGNYATDLSPLKGLPLTDLSLNGSAISDLAPLAEMKLDSLNIGTTAVADLSPLHGMKLKTLICERSRVRDLAPLAAMPLHVLDLHQTGVSDLSPVRGMPLEDLSIDRTSVADLSPLAEMRLKRFSFSPGRIHSGLEAIRGMQSLEKIAVREGRAKETFDQTLSPAEFWKKYDAGEFHKPPAAVKSTVSKPMF